MKILVPINIEEKDGCFSGRFTFDPETLVSGNSKEIVLNKLYKKVAPSLQCNKDIDLIEDLESLQSTNSDFLQVDFFSVGEHRVMMGLLLFLLFGLYIPVATALTFLWSVLYSPLSRELFTQDLVPIFSTYMANMGMVRIVGFICVWNVVYNYVYPKFIEFYSNLILSDAVVFALHKQIVTRLSFQKTNDYDIKAVLK